MNVIITSVTIIGSLDLKKFEQIIINFKCFCNTSVVALNANYLCLLSAHEVAPAVGEEVAVVAQLVLARHLLERLLLLLTQLVPPESHRTHDLCNCQKRKTLSYDISEFLAEVNIC